MAGLILISTSWAPLAIAIETVRFPDYPDPNKSFFRAALQLALDKSGHAYQLAAIKSEMLQGRSIAQAMKPAGGIDVLWSMTTREREAMLLPVRFPIDRGLLGWRIALVRKDKASQFARIDSLQALRYFTAGQEHDWPDYSILRHNGLPVIAGGDYASLFSMLANSRFDYFPRGITEAWSEVNQWPQLNLTIEPFLVLHYPAAEYFFVTPSKPALAEDIRIGLTRAQADGSFDKLFHSHFDPLLRKANLIKRHTIELTLPPEDTVNLLPPKSPWWYQPR
ncbi:ABC transporter substrate-binding protein [Aquitalea aquatilis]|uniref:ABC transporter substrate-binding protein n=1 Tax=Aquitalea aquatilis TaxID=1537400 RepID=UPI0010BD6DC6|nr:ABC transporter substrate-binding protein [Aquitalea aquatilis]